MKHNTLGPTRSAMAIGSSLAVLAAVSFASLNAQAPAHHPSGRRPAGRCCRTRSAARVRPSLILKEEWKETTETGDITVTQQHVANPNLSSRPTAPARRD